MVETRDWSTAIQDSQWLFQQPANTPSATPTYTPQPVAAQPANTPSATPTYTPQPVAAQPVQQQYDGPRGPIDNILAINEEVGKMLYTGGVELFNSIGSLPKDFGLTETNLWKIPDDPSRKPETLGGQLGSTIVQFAIPYTGIVKAGGALSKAARLSKLIPNNKAAHWASKALGMSAAAGATTFIAFDPKDPNLSTLIQQYEPAMQFEIVKKITDYLATDENDSDAVGRLKNGLEELGIGAAFGGLMLALKGGLIATKYGAKGVGKGVNKHVYERGEEALRTNEDLSLLDPAWYYREAVKARNAYINSGSGFQRVDDFYKKHFNLKDSKSDLDSIDHYNRVMNSGHFMQEFIHNGTFVLDSATGQMTRTGEGLADIMSDAVKLGPTGKQDFTDFLLYTRNKELASSVKGNRSPMPLKDINDNLQRLQASLNYPAMQALQKRMQDFNKRVLDFAKSSDILDDDMAARMLAEGMDYVPLYRVKDNKMFLAAQTSPGYSNMLKQNMTDYTRMSDADKAKMLAKEPIDDVISNYLKNFENIMEAALKNIANKSVFEKISKLGPDGERFAVRADKKVKPTYLSRDTLIDLIMKIQNNAQATRGINLGLTKANLLRATSNNQIMTIFHQVAKQAGDTSVVFRKDPHTGKQIIETWKINDPILLESARTFGFKQTDIMSKTYEAFVRGGEIFKRIDQVTITTDPNFLLVRNLVGDALATFMQADTRFIPIYDSYKYLFRHAIPNSKLHQEYIRNGGGFGRHLFGDAERNDLLLQQLKANTYIGENKMWLHRLKNLPETVTNVIGYATEKFEYASRGAYYARLKQAGYDDAKAAAMAKEIGVNFAVKGSSKGMQNLARVTPFLNASIQSIDRFIRVTGMGNLGGKPMTPSQAKTAKQVWMKMVGLTTTLGVGMPYLYESGVLGADVLNKWNSIPDYVKNTHYIFLFPDQNNQNSPYAANYDDGTTGFLLRKPFDFAILDTLASKLIDQSMNNEMDRAIVAAYAMDLGTQWFRLDQSAWIPSVFQPMVDHVLNRQFGGRTIIPKYLEGKEGQDLYVSSGTSETAKQISIQLKHMMFGMEVAPDYVDNYIEGYFNSYGRYVRDYLLDPLISPKGTPEGARRDIATLPLTNVFKDGRVGMKDILIPEPYAYTPTETEIGERVEQMPNKERLIKNLMGTNAPLNVEKAMQHLADLGAYEKKRTKLSDFIEEFNKINSMIAQIEQSARLNVDQKTILREQYLQKKYKISLQLLKDFGRYEK
jgi:hypothetical protein